ncbi:MAG: 50S ribosomal protein L10 [Bacteroidales bacterium]|jgi:large subunit ribosomal protein L10|nr:50S ribosomal protein L10 [Bacteroidales bacterium]MBQ3750129.1 50S ribosomal protein L10 [Bacteroidales bacterium]MBR0304314.1 50S ribosomal protein L10 [Bacteroidales bacterium]MBR3572788.1 50S ribosomal protein L10 [Bacteroidales bacterium]MBR4918526.1 50S ribosomal protein L10 [Bacteroidales bacterium]
MKQEQKAQIIEEIAQDLANYSHVYVTDISGFTVSTVNQLRRLCFKRDVKLKVVKNTLLKRAMDQAEADYSEIYPVLNGATSIMLCNTGNVPARLIKEFRAKNDKPLIKAAFIEETAYIGDDQLEALCNIKSREELIGDIVALLQSPAKNVVSALQSGGGKLAGIVKTLSERQ